jgi:hypothetical protein
MKTLSRTFHLYRYQILPTVEDLQLDFIAGITSKDELIRRKNAIFADVIKNTKKEFFHPRAELTHQLYEMGDFMVLKLGANRSLIRITKSFEEEELENWPSVYVVINNNPEVQLMAVELEARAFYRSSTVVNVLETNINSWLEQFKLEVRINPTFLKNEFWRVVQTHKNRITYVEFFMVAPNLSNISKGLELDLGELKSRTNSINTNLALRSPKGERLTLSEDDRFVQSLVNYSAEGGGTIHLKARNIRKTIKTEDSVKSIEIDEINFTGDHIPEQLVSAFNEVLKND